MEEGIPTVISVLLGAVVAAAVVSGVLFIAIALLLNMI
jgi:hypothetical protein